MRDRRLWLCCGFLVVTAIIAACGKPPVARSEPFYRGMTISCQTGGEEWAMPQMASTLDEVKKMGVNAIEIHPYARIQNDGSLVWDHAEDPDYVARPLDWARERGMRVLLVPHIAYWGTKFQWRGEIQFADQAGWDRFFGDYQAWIVHMAKIAEKHHAAIFCIGLEYGPTQKFDARWRQIIAAIRAVYHGKLTYGANWDEIGNVPWWDDLDYIGALAYFPLTKKPNPSEDDLRQGWQQWIAKLQTLSHRYGKPVLFTEIGYNESALCAAQPWDFHDNGGDQADRIQARCIRVATELESSFPELAGMFWWKWFPKIGDPEPETFDLRKPTARAALEASWGAAK